MRRRRRRVVYYAGASGCMIVTGRAEARPRGSGLGFNRSPPQQGQLTSGGWGLNADCGWGLEYP